MGKILKILFFGTRSFSTSKRSHPYVIAKIRKTTTYRGETRNLGINDLYEHSSLECCGIRKKVCSEKCVNV